jgi:pyruvate dehydrogenase (quinone)
LRSMGGAPKFQESQVLPEVDYAGFARSLGLQAITVTAPDQLGAAWDTALAGPGPVVLDVHCDPEVPPIPPHATFDQMKKTAQSLLKGDPNALHAMVQGTKTKLQEVLPGKKE